MGSQTRVLPARPFEALRDYLDGGGGRGIDAARKLGPVATIEEVEAAGLRGRGGAGFPTGTKWRTVAGFASDTVPATVVVNGAEGEPGTFKDRTLLRRTPYAVIEGAVIAASAVGADRIVLAIKETFTEERARLEAALAEIRADTDWFASGNAVNVGVVAGPGDYLFGEETGLLEVLDGRPPFPRVTPPYRRGVDEDGGASGPTASTDMAQLDGEGAPPTLVNNVETLAHVAGLLAEGATWFRGFGTEESPGTFLVTVTGATVEHGVAEVELGTPLGQVIEAIGGGPRPGRTLVGALSGVANPIIPAAQFDTPLTYEHMRSIGSGLGSGGFIVFDDETDLAAVAAGVSRFLAVESCGQCTPCKQDGLAIAESLVEIVGGSADPTALDVVADRVATVADEARCSLAGQHQQVVGSILAAFPGVLERHLEERDGLATDPAPILPLLDIVDGQAVLDEHQLDKQPDWTYDATDSGKAPVERLAKGGDPG
jgi:NADH:ubiquinone oxidoreductase subunit F (NADH-binding)